jgi:two-component system response regulator VicR
LDAGTRAPAENLVRLGDLSVDLSALTVNKNGAAVEVTQKEFDLLTCLLTNPGKVWSREELMAKVWNYDYFGDMRTVDVTVRRLREKIEDDPGNPRYIRTKRGAGYYSGE